LVYVLCLSVKARYFTHEAIGCGYFLRVLCFCKRERDMLLLVPVQGRHAQFIGF
jgi:hypothetical protein